MDRYFVDIYGDRVQRIENVLIFTVIAFSGSVDRDFVAIYGKRAVSRDFVGIYNKRAVDQNFAAMYGDGAL